MTTNRMTKMGPAAKQAKKPPIMMSVHSVRVDQLAHFAFADWSANNTTGYEAKVVE
jgi:hypothetical protein